MYGSLRPNRLPDDFVTEYTSVDALFEPIPARICHYVIMNERCASPDMAHSPLHNRGKRDTDGISNACTSLRD